MKEFLEKIRNLSKTVSPNFKKFTKIRFEVDDEVRFKDLRKGYWYSPLFLTKGYHHCGLKLSPNKSLDQWATIHQEGYKKVKTISPDLTSFLNIFIYINLRHQPIFELTKANLDSIDSDLRMIYSQISNEQYLKKFKNFILGNQYDDFGSRENLYLSFIDYALGDRSDEFIRILKNLVQDESYLPSEQEVDDCQIFKTRILNCRAMRAIEMTLDKRKDLQSIRPVLWKSFEQVHAYDIENYGLNILPNDTSNMVSLAGEFASRLTKKEHITDEIYSPLFAVAANLYDYNAARVYKGVQHMEAAALYDLEYNDPVRSWNCLVNAAFWSGLNTKETFMPAWDAAIYLAEKNEWIDVHDALVWQKEFYNTFKKKNNLS